MGMTVDQLKEVMTEREFYLHHMQMQHDPDPEDRAAYFMQLVAFILNQISGSGLVFKEPIIKPEMLFPWGKERENWNRSTPGSS